MMKRIYIYMIGVVLLLAGCDVEGSDNGHLDGFWQMTSRNDILSSTMTGTDMRDSGITWSFQGKILELRDVKSVHQDIIASFERRGDTLKVSRFYFVDREKGDRLIETPEDVASYLLPYGIYGAGEQSYLIRELTSGRMVLVSSDFKSWQLEFRKY